MIFMRKLWKSKRGNTLAIAAACFPLFIGAAGLASDTIQWTLWKRQLQRAADSAAIAGVYNREANGGATTGVTTGTPTDTTVAHDLTLNLHTYYSLKSGYPTVSYPADSGSKTDQVTVTVAIQQRLSFSSLFLSTPPTITATSTASAISTGTPCALALNNTGTAMNYSGNSTVSAPTCILYSDSASSNSASAGGSSSVTAKAVDGVGGIQQSNNFNVGSYGPYSPSISDPYANVAPSPSDMKCTNVDVDDKTDMAAMKAAGYNCFKSLSVGSNKTLNVPADFGPIYLDRNIGTGSVDFKGTFNCTGCTIVMTNSSTSTTAPIGTFSSNAQANNNITAPTTGTFAGIAIYQDRRATGNVDKINGGASNVIRGAVYFPSDTLWINGSGLIDSAGNSVSLCSMWVAKNIVFLGNSAIGMSSPDDSVCAGTGMAGGGAKVVRLVA